MTGIYALVHMAVDLSCAFLVYTYVLGGEQWYLWLLLYNFCAFALQMPIGAAADRLDRNSCVAVGGCAGVLAGLLLGIAGFPAGAAVVAGIGNACFHVGGGIDVLNRSERKAAPLGIFVAPGALGIFLGTMLGRAGTEAAVWIGGLLILSAVVIRAAAGREKLWLTSGNAPFSFSVPSSSVPSSSMPSSSVPSGRTLMAAACFLAAVILRSYSGMIQNFPWKDTLAGSGFILAGAVVLGKMAGGVLADKLSIQRTAFRSMCAAAVGFLCLVYPAAGILAVFFWNMSMPLTLWAVSKVFLGAKGFGFGLLTFGLFVGFCPARLGGSSVGGPVQSGIRFMAGNASSPVGMALMAVVSLLLLGWGLKQVAE
ncbi:hypothetical protein H8S75_18850 [Hungatella sp. L12]|uniref:MFS transporter n=1 Tax=Hungatella hominis TaxID=2763050 RepID=A0ABR7HA34_9FIRM|nr:hypothetical protein [Hungatella hominis]MBC5710020.1 hypothetical protein [Hungatella hominis]